MNPRHGTASDTREQVTLEFKRNALLSALAGSHSRNLVRLEQKLGVRLAQRGNLISIEGPPEQRERATLVLRALYRRLEAGEDLTLGDVDAEISFTAPDAHELPHAEATPGSPRCFGLPLALELPI